MPSESLSKQICRQIMSMTIANLSDVDYAYENLLIGEPTSLHEANVRRALEVRRLLEDMKATHASRRVAVLAVCIATASVVISVFL